MMGKEADKFLVRGGIQVAIGARIALRDGRGLRCVLWYVSLSRAITSRRVEGWREARGRCIRLPTWMG